MRFIAFCFLFFCICSPVAYAQHDSLSAKSGGNTISNTIPSVSVPPDSVAMAKANREQYMSDSIAMPYLIPDSLRENQFTSKIYKDNLSNVYSFPPLLSKSRTVLRSGEIRKSRDHWVMGAIIGLLIYTALLNLFLGNDIKIVIQSFYNKHALSLTDKEGGLINSWAFIGLFLLFSLTFALVLCQLMLYKNVYFNFTGFQLFMVLAGGIGLLFGLKFMVLKFIGFIFDVNNLVSQYIAILNLTYFNIAFVLLAVAVCFGLLSVTFMPYLLGFTELIIVVIFAWQYLRNSVNIISNIRFHKFYLFIYLCALEICPILILIKALNI